MKDYGNLIFFEQKKRLVLKDKALVCFYFFSIGFKSFSNFSILGWITIWQYG
jgi:hypothetical protein